MRLSNRPWPRPGGPWAFAQKWDNLLFAHWPIPLVEIRPLVPSQLPIDTWDGTAWLGITPFVLRGLRPKWMPPIPGISRFPEINVRTYVTIDGKPGVFFFSLDAANLLAVRAARFSFGLPYYFARIRVNSNRDAFDYRSARDDPGKNFATFNAFYRPVGKPFRAQPGTFEYFLTERYALYTVDRNGHVWRAEIDHAPWPLQVAEAEIRTNRMADAAGISLPVTDPLLHFSRYIDVRIWRPRRVTEYELLRTRRR